MDLLAADLGAGTPRPAFIVQALISSHGPFSRVPPYIDDLESLGDGSIYHRLPIARFQNAWFEGTEGVEGYAASSRYVLTSIRAYVTRFVGDDTLLVILATTSRVRGSDRPVTGGRCRSTT